MKLNPYINALLATAYIGGISLLMRFIESTRHDTPDTILDGMGFISLFVFSAAVMALLFFYTPAMLLLDGKHKEAISYFLKTLGTFGIVTVLVLLFVSTQ